MIEKLKLLHSEWCSLTGQDPQKVRYQACERYFWDFYNNGFEVDDLRTVITFTIYQNSKREPHYRTHLNLHNLFSDMGKLASLIGEANAWHRNRVKAPTEKARTLAAFRGEPARVEQVGGERTIRDVMKSIQ